MGLFDDKAAWREAISDTIIGTILNFPLNVMAMWMIFELKLGVFESSVLLWVVFTSVAVLRKYCLRIYFQNKSCKPK